jgi:hypothetical protein
LADQLRETYRPDAEALCSGIIDALESAARSYVDRPGTDGFFSSSAHTTECSFAGDAMDSLTFIGRVADELCTSSSFLSTVGCGSRSVEGQLKNTPS